MSRIHEALKKAELERVSVYDDFAASGGDLQRLAEIKPEHAPPVGLPALAQPKIVAPEPQPNLRFEDLQARCVQQWQPDPSANVFSPGVSVKAAEQFRTLRSRLYQVRTNQQLKTLLVTSAISGEGKTFVATNLGHAISRQAERRVLLIDADLRHSHMHVPLGAQRGPGLSDYLRGGVNEVGVIQYSPDNNLCIIAGGSEVSNPSELLSNGRLVTLLGRVAPLFEWVIVDSPPSVPVADASVLAEHCDALILVVRARMTPASVLQKGLQELQGRKIVGVVLNSVKEEVLGYGYRSTYGHDYLKETTPKT
jgi:capsular exopolysaccharide synthesis family protein